MSEFNWDDQPDAVETTETQEFNWDDQPDADSVPMGGELGQDRTLASIAQEQNPEGASGLDVSPLRSAIVGAGQGITFGAADEIMAPVAAGVAMLDPTIADMEGEQGLAGQLEKYKRLMSLSVDTAREEQKAAQEQNPKSYMAGSLAGGVLVPGVGAAKAAKALKGAGFLKKLGVGAGMGAAYGAAAGAGEAEGGLEERLEGAKEGAKTGALVGMAIPTGAAALSKLGRSVKKIFEIPFLKKPIDAFSEGLEGHNLALESGRKSASDAVATTGKKMTDDVIDEVKIVGKEIEEAIQGASDSGKTVDLQDMVTDVLEKLNVIKREGSENAVQYAKTIERKLKKALKIQDEAGEFAGVGADDLPEGIVPAKVKQPDLKKVDPVDAKQVKDIMSDLLPEHGMNKLEREPAVVAGEIYGKVGEKLTNVTDDLTKLNKQYGSGKDVLKLLNVNQKDMPVEIANDVRSLIAKIQDENISGDNASDLITAVIEKINTLSPEIAGKYREILPKIVQRFKVAQEISKGYKGGLIGNIINLPKLGGNLAGLGLNKLGVNTALKGVSKVSEGAKSFADVMLAGRLGKNFQGSGLARLGKSQVHAGSGLHNVRTATEPYKIQRQVAAAAENAEPEVLQDQAQQIREKHGKTGEQLATILENMSNKDKNARRALMFTVLQNHAYRKMLGLTDEGNDE